MLALSLLLLLVSDEWKTLESANGVTLEIRPVSGRKLDEIRVSAHSELAVTRLCNAFWRDGNFDPEEPDLKARKLLEDKGDERLTYEQIDGSIASDRDFTLLSRRMEDKASGVCQVFFESKNERGPPPSKAFVRVPRVYGSWTFEPAAGGGTDITYFVYSEPGGDVPAIFVKGVQRKAAKKWVELVLRKAAR